MSLLVPLLKPRSLPAAKKIATRSMQQCIQSTYIHGRRDHTHRHRHHDNTGGRAAANGRWQQRNVEDIFIHALVAAGSCQRHRPRIPTTSKRAGNIGTGQVSHLQTQRRNYSRKSQHGQTGLALSAKRPKITKNEYLRLVDTYGNLKKQRTRKDALAAAVKGHQSLAPRLVLTPQQELQEPGAERQYIPPENEHERARFEYLVSLLKRSYGHVDLKKLWSAYEAMPKPRPRYLSDGMLQDLFRHLSWVEYKHQSGIMERYFILLEECIAESVPLDVAIWTSAMAFAGKWVRNITSAEVKTLVETWMRMEKFGHKADIVTFTILFQVAVRAGRFALADTIYNEVKQRDMAMDRMFRTNIIYYAGARQDGDAVRHAFKDMVNAGEIIDTSVMNCVILSLLRAGEFGAAENVFYRMKKLHEDKFGTEAPRQWQTGKALAKVLNKTGKQLRKEKEQHEASFFGAAFSSDDKREQIQKVSPISPDARTYQILIKHHAYTSMNLDRIKQCLAEMHAQELHVHGSVYVHILRGFQEHGGLLSSDWDRPSLEAIWAEIIAQIDMRGPVQEADGVEDPMGSSPVPPAEPAQPAQPTESSEDDSFDLIGAMLSKNADFKPFAAQGELQDISSQQQEADSSGYQPFGKEVAPRGEPPQRGDKPTEPTGYSPFTSEPAPKPQQRSSQTTTHPKEENPNQDDDIEIAEFESQTYITKGLALSAIHAFYKCAGRTRMLQVWREIQLRWKHGSVDDKMMVQQIVDRLVAADSVYIV